MAKEKSPKTTKTADNHRVDELTADLQRVQADFVNYRRRTEEGRSEIVDLAQQDVILLILPLLDNIGRAITHMPKELSENAWAQGVAQISRQADEVLSSVGVKRIESLGHPFDPHLHEAIAHDGDGDVVVEELQPGYTMGDRVIRHAIVKVGTKLDSNSKENK